MWKNTVQPGKPQMTIWPKRIACWIPKATNTHPQYVILNCFSTATMATQTRLSITLYVHSLSDSLILIFVIVSADRHAVGYQVSEGKT